MSLDIANKVKELVETFGEPEELCLELRLCQRMNDGPLEGMISIHHPLFCSVLHTPAQNAYANKTLKQKREAYHAYIKEGRWDMAIMSMVERPYRLDYMLKFQSQMPLPMYWETLRWAWSDTESLWQMSDRNIRRLLMGRKGNVWEMFDPGDRPIWDLMPEKIDVYRGCQPINKRGWSWTTNKKKAVAFARRWGVEEQPLLLWIEDFPREKASFFSTARSEYEVAIDPSIAFGKALRSRMITTKLRPKKGSNEVEEDSIGAVPESGGQLSSPGRRRKR